MGNWGKRIKLTFDREVHHISSIEATRFRLVNDLGEAMYPFGVMPGEVNTEVLLEFTDFNSIRGPNTLECLGCIAMGSPDLPFGGFSVSIGLCNLWPVPSDFEYINLGLSMVGEYTEAPIPECYESEYIQIDMSMSGQYAEAPEKDKRYTKEYIQTTLSMAGQYCDINGVPL